MSRIQIAVIRMRAIGCGQPIITLNITASGRIDRMALDLFCYSDLDPIHLLESIQRLKMAGRFDFTHDFILSPVLPTDEIHREIVGEFSSMIAQFIFLIRLNNKSILSRETLFYFVDFLKSEIPGLLILWENEKQL